MKMLLATRIRPTLIHFFISLLVVLAASLVVFRCWFPAPYNEFAGGNQLFVILVSVDLLVGPLLTFIACAPGKTRRHLAMDLGVIAALQLIALAYGLYVVALARPVVLAAENEAFRVVSANEVKFDELGSAPVGYRRLSWTGPKLVGVKPAVDNQDVMSSLELALQGYDMGTRPSRWQPYEQSRKQVVSQARGLNVVAKASPWHRQAAVSAAQSVGRPIQTLSVLPMLARTAGWYVLLDRGTGEVLGFACLEPDRD